MAKVIVTEQYLTDIADAIRAKLDASDTYTPAQMAGAIESISGTNQDYEDALVAFGVQSDLANGITALTTYSNEITGEDDTTLSDAVRSLADGYGGGDDTDFANTIMRSGAITRIPDSVTKIGPNAFDGCASLALTKLPSGVTSIGTYAFRSCSGLWQLDAQNVGTISASAFNSCSNLTELVLRKSDTACSLRNVSAFTDTPMRGYSGKSGTVYVPSALISTYQTATNWSTLYNAGYLTFAAIEGSKWEL